MNTTLLFQCSGLGIIMGDTENESPTLSNRCKALLQRVYLLEKNKRKPDYKNRVNDGALKFREQGYKLFAPHNKDVKLSEFIIENRYIKGRPHYFTGEDIIHADSVLVINSYCDLSRFSAIDMQQAANRY